MIQQRPNKFVILVILDCKGNYIQNCEKQIICQRMATKIPQIGAPGALSFSVPLACL